MKKNSLYFSVFLEDPETRRNCSRLSYAIDNDDIESVRRFLANTPEMVHMPYGTDRLLPLEKVVSLGKLELCDIVASFGAEIDHVNEISGDSLMHLAARQSYTDIMEWLIGLKAPLDYQNSDGFTALMECVENVDIDGCALLLTAGVDSTTSRLKTGLTALHLAIVNCAREIYSYRHLSLIRLLINWSQQVLDIVGAERDTPLLSAIRCGNFTVAKWLLDAGASPNICDRHSYSPLCLLLHSYHDHVKSGTKKEKLPKTISANDEHQLVHVTEDDNDETKNQVERGKILQQNQMEIEIIDADTLINELMEKGTDLSLVNNRGETALHLAIGNNLIKIATSIARRVRGTPSVLRQLNYNGHSVLHMLARGPQEQKITLAIFEHILQPASPGTERIPSEVIDVRAKDDTTALYNAMCNKKLDVAKCLVERGADVHCICNGETILHAACRSRKIELVVYALEKGLDVNAVNRDYQSAAHLAAAFCPVAIIVALMGAGADVNLPTKPDGYSPFYMAVRCGHSELVDAMLPKVKLDQLTAYGETAMAEAARSGNVQIVSSLIAACANLTTADGKRLLDLYSSRGKPPLVAAAERGHRSVVDVLLKNGANPNVVILDGTSALYAAIGQGQIATVRQLLAWGADLTAVNRSGPRLCCFSYLDPHPHLELSPFFCAAKFQNLNLAKLCAKFYAVTPQSLIRDIISVFSSVLEDDEESRWSPIFISSYLDFLNAFLHKEPSTLQHQCRVKIRTILGSPLPLRLAFLPVPIEIKDFVLMRRELSEGAADDPQPNPPPPAQNNAA